MRNWSRSLHPQLCKIFGADHLCILCSICWCTSQPCDLVVTVMLISGQTSKEPIWKIKWLRLHPSPQLVLAWRGSVLKHLTIPLASWSKHHGFFIIKWLLSGFSFACYSASLVFKVVFGVVFNLFTFYWHWFSLTRGLLFGCTRITITQSICVSPFHFWFTVEAFVLVSWTWFKRRGKKLNRVSWSAWKKNRRIKKKKLHGYLDKERRMEDTKSRFCYSNSRRFEPGKYV